MASICDLTGNWTGFYRQHDHVRPISAHLVQRGGVFAGTMNDGETSFEMSVTELAQEAALPPGADEVITARLREEVPEEKGPIRVVSKLPPYSIIEGRIDGDRVEFTKTYQGEHFSGYRVGEKLVGVPRMNHQVRYHGTIAADVIAGRWLISTGLGICAEGEFELRRQS